MNFKATFFTEPLQMTASDNVHLFPYSLLFFQVASSTFKVANCQYNDFCKFFFACANLNFDWLFSIKLI